MSHCESFFSFIRQDAANETVSVGPGLRRTALAPNAHLSSPCPGGRGLVTAYSSFSLGVSESTKDSAEGVISVSRSSRTCTQASELLPHASDPHETEDDTRVLSLTVTCSSQSGPSWGNPGI